MKFLIYGAGNTGHALSAYLASKNTDFTLFTRDPKKADLINQRGLDSEGAIQGHFSIKASADLAESLPKADIIIVMTAANTHRDAAQKMKPLLQNGQKILISNSNWGAFEFMQVLGNEIAAKNLTVAEMAAQLFVGSAPEPGKVTMNVKSSVYVAATDPAKTQPLLDELKPIFPQFAPASSIFETSLSSTNPLIHVPISIMNMARVQNAEHFLFYAEGTSKKSVDYILGIDNERVAVGKALGCHVDDVLTAINSFWEIKHDNLFDALTLNETYRKTVGPKSLSHRYFTEDIPYGIVPIAKIGKLFGVPTPFSDAILEFINLSMGGELELNAMQFSIEDFNT
jgi:opine dehydrogenase